MDAAGTNSLPCGALLIDGTPIIGGTDGYILFDNNGIVGEQPNTGGGLTVGTTIISGGTSGFVLFDNGGILGEEDPATFNDSGWLQTAGSPGNTSTTPINAPGGSGENGPDIDMFAGNGDGAGFGGNVNITGGNPAGNVTVRTAGGIGSGGGDITITSGNDSGGGAGGGVALTAGDGASGGNCDMIAGNGLTGPGGNFVMISGNSGSAFGANFSVNGASPSGAGDGGSAYFVGGNGSSNLDCGDFNITGGNNSGPGMGGSLNFFGGNGSTAGGGDGGAAELEGGVCIGNNATAGDFNILGASASGKGGDGNMNAGAGTLGNLGAFWRMHGGTAAGDGGEFVGAAGNGLNGGNISLTSGVGSSGQGGDIILIPSSGTTRDGQIILDNLPLTDPAVTDAIWNNNDVLMVSGAANYTGIITLASLTAASVGITVTNGIVTAFS